MSHAKGKGAVETEGRSKDSPLFAARGAVGVGDRGGALEDALGAQDARAGVLAEAVLSPSAGSLFLPVPSFRLPVSPCYLPVPPWFRKQGAAPLGHRGPRP